jgi:hypothetical protein
MRECAVDSNAATRCPPSARVATSPFAPRVESGATAVALGVEPWPASTRTLAANNDRADLDIMTLDGPRVMRESLRKLTLILDTREVAAGGNEK